MGYNTHLAKISSAGQVIRVGKINLLRARGEERRGEQREREREEKDYNTHLADISSGSARAVQFSRDGEGFGHGQCN